MDSTAVTGTAPTIENGPTMGNEIVKPKSMRKRPLGLKWRSSSWFITLVVAVGITTDILTYTIVVPVLPYRLQALEYTNISTLTAWLLFAYSLGIFLCTLPVAFFFHRYPWRRQPLVVATLVLEGALIMFMLATPYWVMIVARFLQGAASTVIWSVGFALICENVAEKNVGRQLGFAIAGTSIGATIAPPIGGALYFSLGWYSPFIFCIIVTAVDLLGRMLVIEQKDITNWAELSNSAKDSRPPGSISPIDQNGQDSNSNIQTEKTPPSVDVSKSMINSANEQTGAGSVSQTQVGEQGVTEKPKVKELSPWGVLAALASNPRGCTAFALTFMFGTVMGALDPTLTLRVETIWNKESDFVGLVYLAAAAPTFIAGPIAGAGADKFGAEFMALPALILSLPFLPLLILKGSLPGFIVIFALANLFLSLTMSPVGLEMAMVSKKMEGISEIHQFAAMNVAFSVSSAVGAIVGGQMYDHLSDGWAAVCWFCFACCVVATVPTYMFAGERPLLERMRGRQPAKSSEPNNIIPVADTQSTV